MKSKIFSFFLFIILTAGVLLSAVSCGGKPETGGETNAAENDKQQDINETAAETTTEKITYEVPDNDFEGYIFKVVNRDGDIYWNSVDIYAEAENGDPVNDAVYRRNRIVEDKFNIVIAEIHKNYDAIPAFVQKSVQSGGDDFDFVHTDLQRTAGLVQKGFIVNLYGVPHLNFNKPWWNKVANDSMTIGGKLYFAIGDINLMNKDATWAVLFNKELNAKLGLEDPYKQVNDGKWTLDVLHSNCKDAAQDLNGDGILTPEDQWGAVNQHECAYCLFAGSGQKMIEKDSNDLPVLALNSDRTVSVLTKVIEFLADGSAQIKADDYFSKYADAWTEVNVNSFIESRALYYISPIETVKFMRNMEANFGILPLPKYDEAQEKYYNSLQYNNASALSIPSSAPNLERSGSIIEVWAAESVDTLTKAYYEINLKGKHSRDEESAGMLDLIFSTRVIDQGMLFNWSGVQGFFEGFSKSKKVDFASQYEKNEPKWLKAIEKTLTAIEESN